VLALSRSLAWSFRWRRLGRSGRLRGVWRESVEIATSFHRIARRLHNRAERRLLKLEIKRWASTLPADRMRPSRWSNRTIRSEARQISCVKTGGAPNASSGTSRTAANCGVIKSMLLRHVWRCWN